MNSRIKKLHIPPAWKNVKVSKDPTDHIQVTGIDNKGRTQYIYHPLFNMLSSCEKFNRLKLFCKKIPLLIDFINKTTRKESKESINYTICLLFRLLLKTYIRVGNECYNTYGLTTLQKRHVNIKGNLIHFNFIGKKNVEHNIIINDKLIAEDLSRILKKLKNNSSPLFPDVNSTLLNNSLKKVLGDNSFCCKDFRTYASNKLFIEELCSNNDKLCSNNDKLCSNNDKLCSNNGLNNKEIIRKSYKKVAEDLGHTASTSRKSYVFPEIENKFIERPELFKKNSDPIEILVKILEF